MINWNFEKLEMEGAYVITPFFAEDVRGSFLKDYSKKFSRVMEFITIWLKSFILTLTRE